MKKGIIIAIILCLFGMIFLSGSIGVFYEPVEVFNKAIVVAILIIAGKMHAAGIDEPIVDMNSIKDFIEAGADVILMPAVNTVPGLSEQEVTEACRYIKAHGALSLSAIGTSQEGADEGTIREIALLNKRCGIDIQHIGDAGFCGIALPENIMALSIAIRGKRHTYHKIASSINR